MASKKKEEPALYVDAFIIEANGLRNLGLQESQTVTTTTTSSTKTSTTTTTQTTTTNPLSSLFGRLSFGGARYSTREKEVCDAPVWNEDCTFTLPVDTLEREDVGLDFCLYERVPGMLNFSSVVPRGKTFVSLYGRETGKMIDLTLPLSRPEPSSSSSKSSKNLPPMEEKKEGEKEKGQAFAHLVIYITKNQEEGILSAYGKPMKSIPFRLAPGDLLLLSTTEWSSLGVQLVTWSQWDHVAMVTSLRDRPGALRFFEVSQDGVEFYALDHTLDFYLSQNSTIGVRRLKINRTPAMMDALYTFGEETRGRPYKKDYLQLVRSLFQSNQEDDTSSLFCSQLIAAAYQQMGIVKSEIPSNNFLPSHFADAISDHLCCGELDQLVTFSMK